MKLSVNTLLVASTLLLPLTASANKMECVTEADVAAADGDLFPEKVTPEYSTFWDVSYHGTYKIFTNKASDLSYLLYQCGTEPPSEELDGRHAGVMAIPTSTTGVSVASTPMISYLELLGLRTQIVGFLGPEATISSPCLLELIDEGDVGVVSSGSNATAMSEAGLLDDPEMIAFVSAWTGDVVPNNAIVMEEYEEDTYEGTMEWIKAYGAIFNLEGMANDSFEQAQCRFDAIEADVESVTAGMPETPTVLWAYYSDFCGGWDVAKCPNYYCEFASACKADILNSTEGSAGMELCGAPYMTTEEFVAFGKDADHWIYPSSNWNSIYAENEQALSEFTSVNTESVFDYQGSGGNAWFEQRYAEYDIALNDFCLVTGTAAPTSEMDRRLFFRNVFTEPVGTLEQCQDPAAPYEPRGNAWTKCGDGEMMNNEPIEEIPAEMPEETLAETSAEEEAPTVEVPTGEEESELSGESGEAEATSVPETPEAPASSGFLMATSSAAFAGLVSIFTTLS